MKKAFAGLFIALSVFPANPAIDVPAWIGYECSGSNDVHRLTLDQLAVTSDGYKVPGYRKTVPFSRAQPSQDEYAWAFYSEAKRADDTIAFQSDMFCLLVPPSGV